MLFVARKAKSRLTIKEKPVFGQGPRRWKPLSKVVRVENQAALFPAPVVPTPKAPNSISHTPEELSTEQQITADAIRERTRANPISAKDLKALVGYRRVREITAMVVVLEIEHGLPIGTSRRKPSGYYWNRTEEDWKATLMPYMGQILSMIQNFLRRAPGHFARDFERRLNEVLVKNRDR
jgi:hypothetical protein